MSLEETVGYINRYLQQDFGDHVSVDYVDVDSSDIERYPQLVEALKEGASIPLVLVGDAVKVPAVLSFSWVVNEFRGMGALE